MVPSPSVPSSKEKVNDGNYSDSLDRTRNLFLKRALEEALESENLEELRKRIRSLLKKLNGKASTLENFKSKNTTKDQGILTYSLFREDLDQIAKSQTLERARYYLKRLSRSLTRTRTNKINEINLNRWKEYDDIVTDSLWNFERRDTSGVHLGWYWGNFIPQIPHQIIIRYTKKEDWVLDPFAGSGTTLIECVRLGRNGIGIEINGETSKRGRELIRKEANNYGTSASIVTGDSATVDFKKILEKREISKVQLVIMHPPYHDIIKFSNDLRDLSNAPSLEKFLEMFGRVVDKTYPILQEGRYLAVVIGDKYQKREWKPLGFMVMNTVLKRGYQLVSIVVKNFEDTRSKRFQKELWRYRALVGGFYVFKHEYICIFRKPKIKKSVDILT